MIVQINYKRMGTFITGMDVGSLVYLGILYMYRTTWYYCFKHTHHFAPIPNFYEEWTGKKYPYTISLALTSTTLSCLLKSFSSWCFLAVSCTAVSPLSAVSPLFSPLVCCKPLRLAPAAKCCCFFCSFLYWCCTWSESTNPSGPQILSLSLHRNKTKRIFYAIIKGKVKDPIILLTGRRGSE